MAEGFSESGDGQAGLALVLEPYESTPAMLHILDGDGLILAVSNYWLAKLGYRREEVVGRSILAFLTPESRERSQKVVFPDFQDTGSCMDVEYQMLRANGDIVDVLITASLLHSRDKALTRITAVVREITAEKQMRAALRSEREALRKSERLLKRTNEVAGVGGWELDLASNQVRWSEEMFRILRAPADYQDSLEERLKLYTPRSRALAWQAIAHAIATGEGYDIEIELFRFDGTLMTGRAVGAVEWNEGKAVCISGTLQDISGLVAQRERLRQTTERLELATESGNIGIWEWDFQQDCASWSPIMYRLYGLAPSSAVITFEGWRSLVHPEDLQACLESHQDALAGRCPYDFTFRILRPDGQVRHLHTAGRVSWDESEQPKRVIGVTWDVSEQVLQAEEVQQSRDVLEQTGRLTGVGGWQLELATNRLTWSGETYSLLGATSSFEPDYEQRLASYPPASRAIFQAAIHRARTTGAGFDLELETRRPDGMQIWARIVGRVEFTEGRPARIVGALQDISDRVAQREALRTANERVTLATESGGIGIWDWDLVSGLQQWDGRMYQLYSVEPSGQPVAYETWRNCLHADDADFAERALIDALNDSAPLNCEFRVVWPDSSVHHIRATAKVARDSEGQAVRMVGANIDVTESRRLTAELAEQHELLRITLQSIGDGVITSDAKGRVTWLNPEAERMTGWAAQEALGRSIADVFRMIDAETRLPAISTDADFLMRAKFQEFPPQATLLSRTGEELGIETSGSPILNQQEQVLGAVLVFRDVTEQRRIHGEINYRATHDALTGLVNRAEFEQLFREVLVRVQRERTTGSLLYIDLDNFKIVNDTCGHAVGDQLLCEVTKLLKDSVRASDMVARLGGDEFAIILAPCTASAAGRIAQDICDRMENFLFVHDDKRFRLGTSIGSVILDERWRSTEAALHAADAASQAAKAAGRNRVHAWFDTEDSLRERQGEMRWGGRIEQALDEDRFTLLAQIIAPIQGAGGEEPLAGQIGAEVFLRMVEPDGTLVVPNAFLPAAERFHLVTRLDRWVLRRTIAELRSMPLLRLSLNLSGHSVGDRAFHRIALDKLAAAGPEIRRRMTIEISETAVVTHPADALRLIQQLREVEVRVAIDDFGSGAASFGYLKNMPVEYIKIDGQFIRDLTRDHFHEAAVRCFVDIARVARTGTIAECVETLPVLKRLREIGVDFAQGFHVHRPCPLSQIVSQIPRLFAPEQASPPRLEGVAAAGARAR